MYEDLFFLFVFGLIFGGFIGLFLILPMQFLMPGAVLEQYWKEPHFRPAELALFSGIYAPMRTVMLMWLVAFPCFGQKRGVTAADKLAPQWYKIAARILFIWIFTCGGTFILVAAAGTISDYLTGNPIPIPLKRR